MSLAKAGCCQHFRSFIIRHIDSLWDATKHLNTTTITMKVSVSSSSSSTLRNKSHCILQTHIQIHCIAAMKTEISSLCWQQQTKFKCFECEKKKKNWLRFAFRKLKRKKKQEWEGDSIEKNRKRISISNAHTHTHRDFIKYFSGMQQTNKNKNKTKLSFCLQVDGWMNRWIENFVFLSSSTFVVVVC